MVSGSSEVCSSLSIPGADGVRPAGTNSGSGNGPAESIRTCSKGPKRSKGCGSLEGADKVLCRWQWSQDLQNKAVSSLMPGQVNMRDKCWAVVRALEWPVVSWAALMRSRRYSKGGIVIHVLALGW